MDLRDDLQRGILATGIDLFSSTQSQAIITLQSGHNLIIESTFGYCEHIILSTSVLQGIDITLIKPQALILSPSHEMGREVRIYINGFGRFMNINCQVFSSETNISRDVKSLDAGCHIVIGTPDRIFRLMTDGKIDCSMIKLLVLSDIDEHFLEIYDKINRKFNNGVQRLYFVDKIENLSSKMFANSMKIISTIQCRFKTMSEYFKEEKEDGELSKCEDTTLKVSENVENHKMSDEKGEVNIDTSSTDGYSKVDGDQVLSVHQSKMNYIESKKDEFFTQTKKDRKSGLPLWDKAAETFESIGIIPCVLRGIYEFGYKAPSPIQQKSILAILNENEVVIESVTPSGKTVSYVIALLHKLESFKYFSQTLVIVQNSNAAASISKFFSKLGRFSRISCIDCGDAKDSLAMKSVITNFDRKTNVIIGDPYQIYFMVVMKVFDVRRMMAIVLDDADKLFAEGNFDQISNIFYHFNRKIQRIFLCRRMVNETSKHIRKLSTKLVKVLMESDIDVNRFKHYYINVKREESKFATLFEAFNVLELKKALIYCNSESRATELRTQLKLNGIQVLEVDNRMSFGCENNDLKLDKYAIVVCDSFAGDTDLDIELIINYEFPQLYETYKERLGGRLSNVNIVISLVCGLESKSVHCIRTKFNIVLKQMKLNEENRF